MSCMDSVLGVSKANAMIVDPNIIADAMDNPIL